MEKRRYGGRGGCLGLRIPGVMSHYCEGSFKSPCDITFHLHSPISVGEKLVFFVLKWITKRRKPLTCNLNTVRYITQQNDGQPCVSDVVQLASMDKQLTHTGHKLLPCSLDDRCC